jgi:hypothetical protein
MISVTGQIGQSATITLTPIPSNGQIDPGSIKYNNDNPGAAQVTPSADNLSAKVTLLAPGTVNITAALTSYGTAVLGDASIQITSIAPAPPPVTGLHVDISAFS